MDEIWPKQNKVYFQKKLECGIILPRNVSNGGIGGCVNGGIDGDGGDDGGGGSGGGTSFGGDGVGLVILVVVK